MRIFFIFVKIIKIKLIKMSAPKAHSLSKRPFPGSKVGNGDPDRHKSRLRISGVKKPTKLSGVKKCIIGVDPLGGRGGVPKS